MEHQTFFYKTRKNCKTVKQNEKNVSSFIKKSNVTTFSLWACWHALVAPDSGRELGLDQNVGCPHNHHQPGQYAPQDDRDCDTALAFREHIIVWVILEVVWDGGLCGDYGGGHEGNQQHPGHESSRHRCVEWYTSRYLLNTRLIYHYQHVTICLDLITQKHETWNVWLRQKKHK